MRFLRCCLLSVCLAILVLAQSTPFCLAGVPPVGLSGQTIPLVDPPGIPTLLSPPDGAETTGVTDPPVGVPPLRWSAVVGATKYHVQVSASSGFATLVEETDTYATTYTPLKALAEGEAFWRVKACAGNTCGLYSAAFSFTKTWIADPTHGVQLLQPADGATFAAFPDGGFVWTAITGAATYLLEIGSSNNPFGGVVYNAYTIKPQHTPTRRLANSEYYWRVMPLDHQGHRGLSREQVRSFTFDWDLKPTLLSPAADSEVAFVPRFSWTAVEAANEYRLEISSDAEFKTLIAVYGTRNTDYTPVKALANDQDYYWRVRATDYEGHNGPYSEKRRLVTAWHYAPQLLSPANLSPHLSYPFFNWTTVPGAERYEIQIDPNIADVYIYNATTYAQPQYRLGLVEGDYRWWVRGVDAQGNYTPWSGSDKYSFRSSLETSPNPIYPPYYYDPNKDGVLPVHSERSIAWPVFVWDTAHHFSPVTRLAHPPSSYDLTVDDDATFGSPILQTETAGLGAAPTLSNTNRFDNWQDGRIYYWRVRAFDGPMQQMGTDVIWEMRYDSRIPQLPFSPTLTPIPIYPRDGYEAVAAPPVFGWQPVTGTHHYRVQISNGPISATAHIVDEAQPLFVNYVPWQGRLEPMPFGTYWWRVRAEDAGGVPLGEWSERSQFNLSAEVLTGNPYDFVPPPNIITSSLTSIVSQNPLPEAGAFGLGALHVMLDRTYTGNHNWVIAFESAADSSDILRYGLYFDTNHLPASGASVDLWSNPITVANLYLPDYALYINRSIDNGFDANSAYFVRWDKAQGVWGAPYQTLASIGGEIYYDPALKAVQVLLPYAALTTDADWSGSVALTVFSTSFDPADGMRDSTPRQEGLIAYPAFVSDMLLPLYPFDTPLSNPMVHYDMPPMRWRMPTVESVDGYQVEIARDPLFTDLAEKWETYETGTSSFYALLPATCQPTRAYADNESYYWRVRVRHERYASSTQYDYGPWSPAMRFKLDSREIPTTTLTPQGATMTTTFEWPRVEGASGYTLQVDNDTNFSSPLVNVNTDATSYTPPETTASQAFANGTYYWRVAMRRSSIVMGRWTTPTLSFEKVSAKPEPLYPLTGQVVTFSLPTFSWSALLTPTAAPRYRLQVASDLNFSSPRNYTTDGASYTLLAGQSLADGTWYWRVAMLDGNGQVGTFSAAQSFYKEYRTPTLLFPAQGAAVTSIPVFSWQPLDGAAYYRIEIADSETFNKPIVGITDNARYTPVKAMPAGDYYWRVQMYDDDDIPGSRFATGRITVGSKVYLPICIR